ncbi:hypothetical protein NDU88_003001, partial [Pleurodeles waltl]
RKGYQGVVQNGVWHQASNWHRGKWLTYLCSVGLSKKHSKFCRVFHWRVHRLASNCPMKNCLLLELIC